MQNNEVLKQSLFRSLATWHDIHISSWVNFIRSLEINFWRIQFNLRELPPTETFELSPRTKFSRSIWWKNNKRNKQKTSQIQNSILFNFLNGTNFCAKHLKRFQPNIIYYFHFSFEKPFCKFCHWKCNLEWRSSLIVIFTRHSTIGIL